MEAISNKQLGKHQGPDRNRNYENSIVGNGHLEHDDKPGSSEHSSKASESFKSFKSFKANESNHFEPEQNDIQLQSLQDKHDVPGNNSSKLEEGQYGDASLRLTSEVSSVMDEPTLLQSPPVQVMDRVRELDCYKIPSAVFARSESITPVDHWSVPSNESLFSIPLENGSFARDQIVGSKYGELFKSGEFNELSLVPVSTVSVEDTNKMGGGSDNKEETSLSADVFQDNTGPSTEEPNKKKPRRPMISWNSATIAHHSVDTVATERSIASPVRNKKSVCSSCNRSSCWSAFCCNWKCTTSPYGTCLPWKEKAQEQQQEVPMASSIPSKSARRNCCSCFSSCR